MDSKLTLKLDQTAIERARQYAKKRGISLSRLVEIYFLSLAEREAASASQPTGVVAELAGILAGKQVGTSKEGRIRFLVRKHS